ncbi:hypothetical protein ADILRU_1406 [Leifsonia rubra CMS 76R]|nr:hypothetical protein ADILRU_1406 [Leifsonia rubra CMS 76R]
MAIFPMDDPHYAATYAAEGAMVDAAQLIATALESSSMTQSELARALRVSRSEITARLRGERNITIRKLAETLHALGHELDLRCEQAEIVTSEASTYTRWASSNAEEISTRSESVTSNGWQKREHVAV